MFYIFLYPLLQNLKFDIVYDNGVSLEKIVVYLKFPKEVPVFEAVNGSLYPNFAPAAAFAGIYIYIYIYLSFACRTHIIVSRKTKCETCGIFKSFLIQESFSFTVPQICFVLLTICLLSLPRYISCLLIFFDFKSGMTRLCNVQTTVMYTYFPKNVPVCGKSDILI